VKLRDFVSNQQDVQQNTHSLDWDAD